MENARDQGHEGPEFTWENARPYLEQALASLSPGRREAVLRYYLEGKSQADAAAELGCSVDAVKTRVHEGLERMRAFFLRRGLTLGVAALGSGLASEAVAAEPTFILTCAKTVFSPVTASSANALAHGVTTAMFITSAILVTAITLLVGSAVLPASRRCWPVIASLRQVRKSSVRTIFPGNSSGK